MVHSDRCAEFPIPECNSTRGMWPIPLWAFSKLKNPPQVNPSNVKLKEYGGHPVEQNYLAVYVVMSITVATAPPISGPQSMRSHSVVRPIWELCCRRQYYSTTHSGLPQAGISGCIWRTREIPWYLQYRDQARGSASDTAATSSTPQSLRKICETLSRYDLSWKIL